VILGRERNRHKAKKSRWAAPSGPGTIERAVEATRLGAQELRLLQDLGIGFLGALFRDRVREVGRGCRFLALPPRTWRPSRFPLSMFSAPTNVDASAHR
jgi:hypothetical protein